MIQLNHVSLEYPVTRTLALDDINLHIRKGEFVYLIGRSGAGKSSVMNLILKRISPTRGQVMINDEPLSKYRGGKASIHRRRIGMIFQDNMLLPHFTVEDNIALALRVTNVPQKDWHQRITNALKMVSMEHKRSALPMQLSLGEQQRAAIARAIVTSPPMILADEPTGNLDPEISVEIMKLLQQICVRGATVVVATHAKELVENFRHRTITLRKGKIVRDDPYGGYAL
ncbi:cell division ATP-binding protein FtsE [Deinococcus roseus]|uniref:Cell division ATP-binding protein FtsE n=1 Tax=Deinococcus roseus TaxID=392414 RepID=A0ABQ2CW15_9DEIO|nr:cell division ATP-binding protein FtsE [Deinococcus roseus]GGJ21731.1 hypothetical protein GCM10008938_04920 [Deinococcus roseus]